MTEVLMWHSKKPRRLRLRGFSIPFWVGGLIPRLATSYSSPSNHLQMYQRQLNLNQLLEKSERDGRAKDKQIADLQTENASLRGQIRSLTAQMDEIKAELWDKINNLRDKLRGAYESLTNVVKAVGMLKYDREKDQNGNYTYGKYGISNLSKAQEKLIDGLAEYGAKWAKEDGFPEMAEEMEKHVGISKGIEKIVEPPAPKRSKGWEMEL